MGKPLGLGQVKLEPVALRLIERRSRYFAGNLVSPRYSQEWQARDFMPSELPANWQEPAINPNAQSTLSPENRATQFRSGEGNFCDIEACAALEVIGSPQSTASHPVHYPQTKDQKGQLRPAEQYKWFVFNNKQGQHLASVTNGELTPLQRNERFNDKR